MFVQGFLFKCLTLPWHSWNST